VVQAGRTQSRLDEQRNRLIRRRIHEHDGHNPIRLHLQPCIEELSDSEGLSGPSLCENVFNVPYAAAVCGGCGWTLTHRQDIYG